MNPFLKYQTDNQPLSTLTAYLLKHLTARIQLAGVRADRARAAQAVESWRRARALRRTGPALDVGDLAIDGRDLMRLGFRPGPHFGEILDRLLDLVIEDPELNDAATLADEALRIAAGMEITGGSGAGETRREEPS